MKNNIQCINTATNEDTYFIWDCFFNADKISYLNDYIGVKHYERNVKEHVSLTHDYSKNKIIGTIEAFKQILILINNSNPTKDFYYDPYILNIFIRFNYEWNFDKTDKIEIFKKVLNMKILLNIFSNSHFILKL